MISEEQLHIAVVEYNQIFMETLPETEASDAQFSPQFHRKMRRLIQKTNHPVRYRLLRGALAAVLSLVILFSAVLAASPEVRAAVVRWLQTTINAQAHYFTDDPQGTLPSQYRHFKTIAHRSSKTYLYIDDATEQIAQFSYYLKGELVLNTDNCVHSTAQIGGVTADIYLSNCDTESNEIVWRDPSGKILLSISSYEDRNTMIRMAESIMEQLK